VKKFAAILFFSIYTISITGLYELLKINVLVEHYSETTKHDGPVSFTDFLIMHYLTDDGNNKDNDRDHQLPFKSTANCLANTISIVVLQKQEEGILKPASIENKKFYNHPDPFIPSNFYNSVWNPPKLV
jgi:hypothetical protein